MHHHVGHNRTVNKMIVLPVVPTPEEDPLLAWLNDVLQCRFTDYAPLRSGAAYCQLLHILFPYNIDLRLVHFQCYQMVEFVFNYELLQLGLARSNILFHVPVRRLILENAPTDLRKVLKWFYNIFQQRPKGPRRYNARQARCMLTIKHLPSLEQNIIRHYFHEMDTRRAVVDSLTPRPLSQLPAMIYGTKLTRMAIYVCNNKIGLASNEVERELIKINSFSALTKPTKYYWGTRDLVLNLERLNVQLHGTGLSSCIEVNRRRRDHCLPWQQIYLFADELNSLVSRPNLKRWCRTVNCLAYRCSPLRLNARLRRLFNVRIIVVSFTEWMACLQPKPVDFAKRAEKCRNPNNDHKLILVLVNLNNTDLNDLSHWSKPVRMERFKPRRIIRLQGYVGDQLQAITELCQRRELYLTTTSMMTSVLPLTEPIDGGNADRINQALEDMIMLGEQNDSKKPTACMAKFCVVS